jgi:hypothetical protein
MTATERDVNTEFPAEYLKRLPKSEREALLKLSVLRWFDRSLYEQQYKGRPPIEFDHIVSLKLITPLTLWDRDGRYTISEPLHKRLADDFASREPDKYQQAHCAAAGHFHHRLRRLDLEKAADVIEELYYLATVNPERAAHRLAVFGYLALASGWPEAAARAADRVCSVRADAADTDRARSVACTLKALTSFMVDSSSPESFYSLRAAIGGMSRGGNRAEKKLVKLAQYALSRPGPLEKGHVVTTAMRATPANSRSDVLRFARTRRRSLGAARGRHAAGLFSGERGR